MKNSYVKSLSLGLAFIVLGLFSCQDESSKKISDKEVEISQYEGYELVWNDEFNYEGLPDAKLWGYDTEGNSKGWGNNEDQFYTKERLENSRVSDGKMYITANYEKFEDKDYTSARMITKESWKYGRFEMSAKLPDARGSWSAFWMMPGGWTFNDGNWPNIGEFDIMEHVGHDIGVIHASAHSKDHQWWKGTQVTATKKVEGVTTDFHKYSWEWDEKFIKSYVDDELYFTYENKGFNEDKWPYNKPFYLILNVAVGGEWGRIHGIDSTAFPQSMEIDYVRVYKKK